MFGGWRQRRELKKSHHYYEDSDITIKKEMIRVLLDISGENFFPSTQLYQLATALLIENQSEFILGVIDEEQHFKEDWEVNRMKRTGRSWGGVDQTVAKIWLDETKAVICARFPYTQKVIDEIRAKIPKGKKSWNPDDKIWEFSVETVDVIVEILSDHFDKVIDLTKEVPELPIIQNGTDPLLSLLDQDDIQKIYKVLVKKYHPDVGGDSNKMARINQVFSKMKK